MAAFQACPSALISLHVIRPALQFLSSLYPFPCSSTLSILCCKAERAYRARLVALSLDSVRQSCDAAPRLTDITPPIFSSSAVMQGIAAPSRYGALEQWAQQSPSPHLSLSSNVSSAASSIRLPNDFELVSVPTSSSSPSYDIYPLVVLSVFATGLLAMHSSAWVQALMMRDVDMLSHVTLLVGFLFVLFAVTVRRLIHAPLLMGLGSGLLMLGAVSPGLAEHFKDENSGIASDALLFRLAIVCTMVFGLDGFLHVLCNFMAHRMDHEDDGVNTRQPDVDV